MNLLVSPLRASLNENNINQLMSICLDGPKFLSEEQLEKIIDIYKDNFSCRISLFFVMILNCICICFLNHVS